MRSPWKAIILLPRLIGLIVMLGLPAWAANSVFVERAFEGTWGASFPPFITQVIGPISFTQISDASGPSLMDGLSTTGTAAAKCPAPGEKVEWYEGTYDYSNGGSTYACTNGSTLFGVYKDFDGGDSGTFLINETTTGTNPSWDGTYTDSDNQTANFHGVYQGGGIATPLARVGSGGGGILPEPPLPTGFVGQAYNVQLMPGQGSASSWTIVAGALPPGLQLNAQSGAITGTPTQPGMFVWTVRLLAVGGGTAIRQYTILVGANPQAPPELEITPTSFSFNFPAGAPATAQGLRIRNTGTGSIAVNIDASTESGGNWLTTIPQNGIATAEQPLNVFVRANPGSLVPGSFAGNLAITGAEVSGLTAALGETIHVPVSMRISARRQFLRLSLKGLSFTAVQGGGSVPSLSFDVINRGLDPMPFSAEVANFPNANWLHTSVEQGTVDPRARTPIEVGVDANGLSAGVYFGLIQVRAAGAAGEVRLLSVVLRVLAAGSRPPPVVEPEGLLFLGTAGGAPPDPQTVSISNVSATALSLTSERLTEAAADPFTHAPEQGQIPPNQPVDITVQPATAGLTAGVYQSLLLLRFGNNTQRAVRLTLILGPGGGSPLTTSGARADCPSALHVTVTSFSGGYPSYLGAPAFVRAQVADDCGQLFEEGNGRGVRAEKGGRTVFLSYKESGSWEATLDFENVGAQGIGLSAEDSVRGIIGTTTIASNVQAQVAARPSIDDGGVIHGASFTPPPLAPGSILSIFGQQQSSNVTGAGSLTLPLPQTLEGTRVRVGAEFLPLFFSSARQVNAGLPLDLDPDSGPLSVVVFNGSIPSEPAELSLAPGSPGLFMLSGTTEGIYQDFPGYQLISKTIPGARTGISPGERLIIYATGLGAVNPVVPSGEPAGADPPSQVTGSVQLTIGGQNATVEYAGLTAGLVSLYQVNAIVPDGVPPGDAEVILTLLGISSSAGVTLSIQ